MLLLLVLFLLLFWLFTLTQMRTMTVPTRFVIC